jgi:hypothetical protein
MYPPPQQPKKRNRALFWIGGRYLEIREEGDKLEGRF